MHLIIKEHRKILSTGEDEHLLFSNKLIIALSVHSECIVCQMSQVFCICGTNKLVYTVFCVTRIVWFKHTL